VESHGHSHPDYAMFTTYLGTILEAINSASSITICVFLINGDEVVEGTFIVQSS
jgi:hypothetical protein